MLIIWWQTEILNSTFKQRTWIRCKTSKFYKIWCHFNAYNSNRFKIAPTITSNSNSLLSLSLTKMDIINDKFELNIKSNNIPCKSGDWIQMNFPLCFVIITWIKILNFAIAMELTRDTDIQYWMLYLQTAMIYITKVKYYQ